MKTRVDGTVSPFTWTRGAVWLLPDGSSLVVPGFHDDWIRNHQDLVPDCDNVCDVIRRKGWLSVVAYAEGYVELMIPSRNDKAALALCHEHLARNAGHWKTALVMTMDEEGYARLTPEDVAACATPEHLLDSMLTQGTGVL